MENPTQKRKWPNYTHDQVRIIHKNSLEDCYRIIDSFEELSIIDNHKVSDGGSGN
jgi:hypothetical protein